MHSKIREVITTAGRSIWGKDRATASFWSRNVNPCIWAWSAGTNMRWSIVPWWDSSMVCRWSMCCPKSRLVSGTIKTWTKNLQDQPLLFSKRFKITSAIAIKTKKQLKTTHPGYVQLFCLLVFFSNYHQRSKIIIKGRNLSYHGSPAPGGWHKAATFVVGICPPLLLLVVYSVGMCRSKHGLQADDFDSRLDLKMDLLTFFYLDLKGKITPLDIYKYL